MSSSASGMPTTYVCCARTIPGWPRRRHKAPVASRTSCDTVASIGHYTELWDNSQVFKDLFLMVENAAQGWDGRDPVRSMKL